MSFSARRFRARWNDAGVCAFMHASQQEYGIRIIDHDCNYKKSTDGLQRDLLSVFNCFYKPSLHVSYLPISAR